MASKIDGKLTYLGSEILRAERKKIFVNELRLLREKCSKTLLSIKSNFLKKLVNISLGVSENLVNIFGVFEKFGQNI